MEREKEKREKGDKRREKREILMKIERDRKEREKSLNPFTNAFSPMYFRDFSIVFCFMLRKEEEREGDKW